MLAPPETKYDPEAALAHDRKDKEKKIEKFLEALKSKKKLESECVVVCKECGVNLGVSSAWATEENKKGKKKEKDSEKPDSFAEKLAVHLTKNLQVESHPVCLSCLFIMYMYACALNSALSLSLPLSPLPLPPPSPQVLVRDIHVRYEDSVTKPGTTLAAGATLHSLEVKVRLSSAPPVPPLPPSSPLLRARMRNGSPLLFEKLLQ